MDTRKTIFVTDGKDAGTFEAFSKALVEKKGKIENIEAISMDMSKSFISGALTHFPKAGIIFDKFHIFKALNEAVDTVRKLEHADARLLKGHRFTLLYNKKNLSEKKAMTGDHTADISNHWQSLWFQGIFRRYIQRMYKGFRGKA